MNHREQELLHLLIKLDQPVSVKTLAKKLGLSERTIRNYIYELNGNNPWISTSKNGISASISDLKAHLQTGDDQSDLIAQNPAQRSSYLIKLLLLRKQNPLASEICESLFISDSTLKADLIRLNREYSDTGIRFRMRKGRLEYTGEEKNIRKVIRSMIRQETQDHYRYMEMLREMFGNEMVSSIHTIWSDLLSRWSADKNELLLANLIFHTTMIVSYSKTIEKLPELNMQPASMHEELCQKLEQNFAILISDVDKRKLEMLCLQCTHAEHISKPVVEYCLRVKERLEKDYFITFSEESFVSMFESHVEVLLSRVTRNERSENPLTKSIRMASPVIYEMAISAADEFYQTFGVILDEGEIAFFALHIGAHVEFASNLPDIYLLCPFYHNLQEQFESRIRNHFQGQACIQRCKTDSLPDSPLVLVVSALPLESMNYPFFYTQISPFVSEHDLQNISEHLDKLKRAIASQKRKEQLEELFFDECFEIEPEGKSPQEILKAMSLRLAKLNLAPGKLMESVLERESLCSTAYEGFAIPHPLHPCAFRPSISVALFPDGFNWNGTIIYCVFLMSLRNDDLSLFREVYEPLINLLVHPGLPEILSKSKNLESFKKTVYEHLP
ncbi:BglG family transcription antiterminator [Ileibacterium valens]|uniref:Uncharacterized protein n=1 Tax=Ileibacterium valens TaxID=1862668 RepID=A0A1U7NJE9_9FIRM|nr:PTS sugar transporter subunit IIA [Ileibacterium valens]OLU39479.1 hypothetical protein BO224_07350 [Erysipelotrichaceae bacterium NYU-BL-E8]OLU39716.1 hypothetical protein BM735_06990 [Erysipelotrichaceae bacterium NYU-BL-F16]OLU43216.1 hypothetical protein BO222_00400 [Ileibacterium valens]